MADEKHAGGRPTVATEWITEETALARITGRDFLNERDLCNFIEQNIEDFARLTLGSELLDYRREWMIGPKTARRFASARVDFYIETVDGQKVIIECKAPKPDSKLYGYGSPLTQILNYIVLAEQRDCTVTRSIYLSTVFQPGIKRMIDRFKLPIDYIVLDKTYQYSWSGDGNN